LLEYLLHSGLGEPESKLGLDSDSEIEWRWLDCLTRFIHAKKFSFSLIKNPTKFSLINEFYPNRIYCVRMIFISTAFYTYVIICSWTVTCALNTQYLLSKLEIVRKRKEFFHHFQTNKLFLYFLFCSWNDYIIKHNIWYMFKKEKTLSLWRCAFFMCYLSVCKYILSKENKGHLDFDRYIAFVLWRTGKEWMFLCPYKYLVILNYF
jgi:hypothetical protein